MPSRDAGKVICTSIKVPIYRNFVTNQPETDIQFNPTMADTEFRVVATLTEADIATRKRIELGEMSAEGGKMKLVSKVAIEAWNAQNKPTTDPTNPTNPKPHEEHFCKLIELGKKLNLVQ